MGDHLFYLLPRSGPQDGMHYPSWGKRGTHLPGQGIWSRNGHMILSKPEFFFGILQTLA